MQILDENPSLHFSLLRLQLVELIRNCSATPEGDITPALEFATTQLAPRAPTNPEFLEDLERTLALLIFPSENLAPPLAALLHPDLRKEIATNVNEAILQSQGDRKEACLRNLVKLRAWAEQKAREAKRDIPDHLDLSLFGDKGPEFRHTTSNNGTAAATNNSTTTQNGDSEDSAMAANGDFELSV
jgi:glucose-induced degradation protein 8